MLKYGVVGEFDTCLRSAVSLKEYEFFIKGRIIIWHLTPSVILDDGASILSEIQSLVHGFKWSWDPLIDCNLLHYDSDPAVFSGALDLSGNCLCYSVEANRFAVISKQLVLKYFSRVV